MLGKNYRQIAAAIGLTGAFVLTQPVVATEEATAAECVFEATLHQSYGLTMEPSRSTFTSNEGTIQCTGGFDGIAVAGLGTMSFVGGTENTWCVAGDGWVKGHASVPTVDGDQLKLKIEGEWNRVGLAMTVTGEVNGDPMRGAIVAQPRDGNCDRDNPLTPEDEGEPVKTVTLRGVTTIGG